MLEVRRAEVLTKDDTAVPYYESSEKNKKEYI
jgi:hypothetical protein